MSTEAGGRETPEYYILSLKWSRKGEPLTWWRANNCGYCWREDWMGVYTAEDVAGAPLYYNDGADTLAVSVDIVRRYVRDATPHELRRFEAPRLVPRSALSKIRAALRRRARASSSPYGTETSDG